MTDMSNNAVGVVDELCELYLNLDRLKIEGECTNRLPKDFKKLLATIY